MRLLELLRAEHAIIERVAESFVTFAGELAKGAAPQSDGEPYLRFFRLYAGRFHHAREEGVLFPALVVETNVRDDRGPIDALLADHRELEAILASMPPLSASDVVRYARLLLHHIDAENSVLFPEAEARFRRACVGELDDRAPDAEEERSLLDAVALVAKYPPREIAGMVRGDGCACCPRYGVDCEGVEREWSTDLELEDTIDRIG